MQGVLARIDANGVSDCSGCLMGHGDVLLVLLSPRSSSERFGAEHGRSIPFPDIGVRSVSEPVSPISRAPIVAR